MASVKTLADGRTKATLLTQKPSDPYAPTVTELNDGIDMSCRVVASDYNVTPAASEAVNEKELCVEGNATAFGPSNATIEFSPFRYFGEDHAAAPVDENDVGDAVFQATKVKGTRLWIYQRETSKMSTEPWEASDEVDGYEFLTDNPQHLERTGYIKRRVVGAFQNLYLNGEVAAVTP